MLCYYVIGKCSYLPNFRAQSVYAVSIGSTSRWHALADINIQHSLTSAERQSVHFTLQSNDYVIVCEVDRSNNEFRQLGDKCNPN